MYCMCVHTFVPRQQEPFKAVEEGLPLLGELRFFLSLRNDLCGVRAHLFVYWYVGVRLVLDAFSSGGWCSGASRKGAHTSLTRDRG